MFVSAVSGRVDFVSQFQTSTLFFENSLKIENEVLTCYLLNKYKIIQITN